MGKQHFDSRLCSASFAVFVNAEAPKVRRIIAEVRTRPFEKTAGSRPEFADANIIARVLATPLFLDHPA